MPMTKRIGFVCEGPTDTQVFSAVISHLFPDEQIRYVPIQPEENFSSVYYTGWKGVLRWCHENGPRIDSYLTEVSPPLDALIVHLDADVSRKEEESHCYCEGVVCPHKESINPPDCTNYETCPITLPCGEHSDPTQGYVDHLMSVLTTLFPPQHAMPVIFVIPCDETETWIVTALDNLENYEQIPNPWESVILAHRYNYHGIRIRKPKKSRILFESLIDLMIPNWEKVVDNCPQAQKFQDDINQLVKQFHDLSTGS